MRVFATLTAVLALLVAVVPIGQPIIQMLENRFPANPTLPAEIDGIIVLGGVLNPYLSQSRGQPQINGAVERLTAAAGLAKSYPNARVIFSGGAGDIFRPEIKEATYAPGVFADLGLDAARVVYESRARNTAENARYTFQTAKPKAGENWVLVTSAFHMPRAVGTFRQAGWKVIPFPVDFGTPSSASYGLGFSLPGGLGAVAKALHECLGLAFYWASGRSTEIFPGPGG